MGTDADSRRGKHRRRSSSSDGEDDVEKSPKRHKHRRHHRHRSKKHDGDAERREEEDSSLVPASASLPPLPPLHPRGDGAVDDDVEEGEILEEDEEGGLRNPGTNADKSEDGRPVGISAEVDKFDNKVENQVENYDRIEQEGYMNGHDHGFNKEDKKRHRDSKEGHKRNVDHIGDTFKGDRRKLTHRCESSLAESGGKVATIECSPFHDNYYDEVENMSKSVSKDHGRERSRSCSLTVDDASSNGRWYYANAKTDMDLDRMRRDLLRVENIERRKEENRSWEMEVDREMRREKDRDRARDEDIGRERRRDKDRERSSDRARERDRKRSSDRARERDRERSSDRARDRDIERERRREKDQEMTSDRARDRDIERERRREKDREMSSDRARDRDMERERRRDKDQERNRDGEIQRDRMLKERERSWDGNVDRTSRRDVEREGSRGRATDMEWRMDIERKSSKDREVDVERRVDRHRGMSRDREDHGSKMRMELKKSRENERDRSTERDRDKEREREWHRHRDRGREYSRGNEKENESRGRDRDARNDLSKLHGHDNSSLNGVRDKVLSDEDEQDDFEERIVLKLAEEEEEDIERIKEESRKRRQAILESFQNQQQKSSQSEDAKKESSEGIDQSLTAATIVPESHEDKIEDGDTSDTDPNFFVKKSPAQNELQILERISGPVGLGEGTPKSEGLDEKYCDDIFGETPARVSRLTKGEALPIHNSGINDNWDDADGYYSYRFGEILDGRYEISAAHGKGVFSAVVRAKDLKAGDGEPDEVAIKIIRNNDTMNKAGKTEVEILQKLAAADPENKRHCVRFMSSFKYKNHLCLVFESLHMNLREVLKKFGRNIGLRLTAVRTYSKQLFIALKHLKTCGILHCDIKPDNMLVNEAKNVLKLCDFGNAMYSGRNDVTPYLVSRFYRAPEIILGLPYDHPMDVWSVGCCLYELYTGKVLFPGPSNNDMLRLHMELKGPFPKKMLKKGAFVDQHFDSDLNFHSMEEDPVSKKAMKKLLLNIKPKDIGSIISSYPGEDSKMLSNFKDLLDKIFVLDPDRRLTVSQALAHPFITGK